ncbi:HEAT repeat domain-containing protein [Paractinoplanes lichenicola]|uniref:HEAT repeat domain-containing protein n=1 Tax=Paractinoplanes lichenicola TaxID=2802976 RepID=A0ABS1VWZ4_9ACTN|nr:HEAT repeat domain-containing protein [Actinoplanes lichenicola]MBL7259006.1 HEAT repeat domain-containing protein [Actinoplanes lichenicola]
MPVLGSFSLTYQWVRELRRWHPGVLAGVQLRIADDEPVTVGRYGVEPRRVTAAEAVAVVRGLDDPRGWEVFVPRALTAGEVRRVRQVPQGVGWRYKPDAHGRRPCPCPSCLGRGEWGAARLRRRFPIGSPRPTKPQLMTLLRDAATADEIIDALMMLGARRRGDAQELAYLVEHPDPEVRETLAETLESYRGRAARVLRAQLEQDPVAADHHDRAELR